MLLATLPTLETESILWFSKQRCIFASIPYLFAHDYGHKRTHLRYNSRMTKRYPSVTGHGGFLALLLVASHLSTKREITSRRLPQGRLVGSTAMQTLENTNTPTEKRSLWASPSIPIDREKKRNKSEEIALVSRAEIILRATGGMSGCRVLRF